MARTINRMRDLRAQLDGVAKRAAEHDVGGEVTTEVESLRKRVLEVEETLEVPDLRPGWGDANNAGARLWDKLIGLPGAVQLGDYRPTDAAEAVFAELKERIDPQVEAFDKLVDEDVPALNAKIANAKLGTIIPLP